MYELTHAERIQYKRRQDTAYQAGEDAVTNLQAALALADLTLPSLSNDGPVAGHGFVRLGGCNAAFANRLAEIVAAGADALRHERKAGKVERPQEGLQQRTVHGAEFDGYRILRAEVPTAPDPVAAFLLAVRDTTGLPARVDRRPTRAH
ncbi:hypothetical protein [Streptomyces sp. A0592]|uniref:hypothetical protein n=1 Tax=Streptomyces sp. A0592 TaxID=2563099 RepID=UPI001F0E75DF|nr:hypothetical protein [Streptomyces sp. A0592]